MNPRDAQIVQSYEELGMTPKEIRAELFPSLGESEIGAILLTYSQKFKDTAKAAKQHHIENPDVGDAEFEVIKNYYKTLALTTDDEHLKEKALRFLWN